MRRTYGTQIAVTEWTAAEIRALRRARRMSVREFAAHLGVADRTVSHWESAANPACPRVNSQALLDTSLYQAEPLVCHRFAQYLAEPRSDQRKGDPA